MILTLDNEYAAVLDACALAPMPLGDTLLRCAEDPALFRALWSELEEVKRTLLQKFGYTAKQVDYRLRVMHSRRHLSLCRLLSWRQCRRFSMRRTSAR